MTYTVEMAAILPKFLMWLSCLYGLNLEALYLAQ